MEKNECFYFGCIGSVGHRLVGIDGQWVGNSGEGSMPFNWRKLDGGFIPDTNKWNNGQAALTVVDNHTILSFPDNSVDSRPASHSTFIAGGIFEFNEMVELAKEAFGQVWKRYEFDVVDKSK